MLADAAVALTEHNPAKLIAFFKKNLANLARFFFYCLLDASSSRDQLDKQKKSPPRNQAETSEMLRTIYEVTSCG